MTWEPKTISLLCPSRWRPQKAIDNLVNHWLDQAKDLSRIEVIFSLRTDDETTPFYEDGIDQYVRPRVRTQLVKSAHSSMPEGLNQAAAVSGGDVLVSVYDDFEAPQFWDDKILCRLAAQPGKCLFVRDGFRTDQLQTIAIMTRGCYQAWGYVLYPAYPGMYSDNDLTEHAQLEERVVWAPDLTFEHRHYLRLGTEPDRTYIETNLPDKYAFGRALLAKRRACQFKE